VLSTASDHHTLTTVIIKAGEPRIRRTGVPEWGTVRDLRVSLGSGNPGEDAESRA